MSNSGIYQIICVPNNKFYIGKTNNYSLRRRKHLSLLRHNKHFNPNLQASFNKYNEESFYWELFHPESDLNRLTLIEQEYLDNHINNPNCFNSDPISGFGGVTVLDNESFEKWRLNMAKGIKDKWKDPIYRENNLSSRHGRYTGTVLCPDGSIIYNAQRKILAEHYGKDSTCWSDLLSGKKKSCYGYRLK